MQYQRPVAGSRCPACFKGPQTVHPADFALLDGGVAVSAGAASMDVLRSCEQAETAPLEDPREPKDTTIYNVAHLQEIVHLLLSFTHSMLWLACMERPLSLTDPMVCFVCVERVSLYLTLGYAMLCLRGAALVSYSFYAMVCLRGAPLVSNRPYGMLCLRGTSLVVFQDLVSRPKRLR